MKLQAANLGKKFVREWVFRNLDLNIDSGERLVILGSNGSGKSTLLQSISGYQIPTEGKITYHNQDLAIDDEDLFRYISIATPYMELIEEYSLSEHILFQSKFKFFLKDIHIDEIPNMLGLAHTANKEIRFFSSGMKQRVKLGLAILADAPLLLLDEPCSNFDAKAIDWYKELIEKYAKGKTIVVCSNHQKAEYDYCTKTLLIEDYKQKK